MNRLFVGLLLSFLAGVLAPNHAIWACLVSGFAGYCILDDIVRFNRARKAALDERPR